MGVPRMIAPGIESPTPAQRAAAAKVAAGCERWSRIGGGAMMGSVGLARCQLFASPRLAPAALMISAVIWEWRLIADRGWSREPGASG